jgi:alpha-N-acetylglucosaminidase
VKLEEWIKEYARYRYGQSTPEIERAWQLLLETVYKSGNRAEPMFCARPSMAVKSVSTWGPAEIKYDPEKLEEAAREFLKARDRLGTNDAYQYDAVDLVRQVLANRGMPAYHKMVDAYSRRDTVGFEQASNEFLGLIRTEDKLLSTRREFLLATWLGEARAMGHDELEKNLCERNARTQITYWGPDDPKTELHEYAHKEWSGLLQDFYLPRWEMFVTALRDSMSGKPLVEPDYFAFEKKWTEEHKAYSAVPSGDPVDEAAKALGSPKTSTKEGTEFHRGKTQSSSAGNLSIAKR